MRLSVENLSFSYGKAEVLHDVTFSLSSGEFMSVLGPNGVGKSTLFQCILGNQPGYSGRVTADGTDMLSLSRRQRAEIAAYIPQIHRPSFGYSVLDTVLMGISRQLGAFSLPQKEHIDCAMDAICRVGAEHLTQRDYSKLSGGEQQLVLIARAIAQHSELLVMDEPTSALDYGNQSRILELIRSLADEGYSILLSTHNPQHALTYADKLLALYAGSVAAYGTPSEQLDQALLYRLYGIETERFETELGAVIVPKCRNIKRRESL